MQVVYFLQKFKGGTVDDVKYQRQIIDLFVNQVIVYDDKITITYNVSGDHNELTADIIENAANSAAARCSTEYSSSPPFVEKSNTVTFFFIGRLFGITVKSRGR